MTELNASGAAEPISDERTTALRDRIAEALYQWTLKAAGGRAILSRHEDDLRENSRARADAVMEVLRPELEAWADMRDLRTEDTRDLHRLAIERDDARAEVERLESAIRGGLAHVGKVTAERDRLTDEKAKLSATVAAFPDAANAANIAHARQQRNTLADQIERVRHRHRPVVRTLDDDDATEITVCLECDSIREKVNDETMPDPYPCETVRVLYGTEAGS
jgi:septal ring factor EnvC (AmiA/AmiB activator)